MAKLNFTAGDLVQCRDVPELARVFLFEGANPMDLRGRVGLCVGFGGAGDVCRVRLECMEMVLNCQHVTGVRAINKTTYEELPCRT